MRLQIPQTISNSSSLQDVIRFASNSIDKMKTIINGNVDLLDNGNNQILSFSFSKLNTDVGVAHTLGRTPRGYVKVGCNNAALSLSDGGTPSNASTLYLQAGSTGSVKVMVF